MRSLVLCTLFALSAASAGAQAPAGKLSGRIDPPLSPRNASYTIDARLNPATRTITGSETIVWRNVTKAPASELRFHLYWNAWRDDKSTWLREAALGFRGSTPVRDEDRGSMDVTSLKLQVGDTPGPELASSIRFIAPDDGNADDRTVMAIMLPNAVAPGLSVGVRVEWTAHVPRTFSRTGAIGNFFFIAQWFPKLGVLQDDGWNCHQFHASTEFFSDYGRYDVRLTVPKDWIVGATGVETETREAAPSQTTHVFEQDDVHDFAWTTSPDYVVHTARFEEPGLPPAEMRLLLQPEHAGQEERHFAGARAALKYYGEWYGPYPYGHITIVDPAWQSGAGGMEYPTLFTAGTHWLILDHVSTPEGVTVHEAGHQFWYGIVGNNEFEDAWMDEGFNTFSDARALAASFHPDYYARRYFGGFVPWAIPAIRLDYDNEHLASYRPVAKQDAQATPSYRYFPSSAGGITYSKTGLWLKMLERSLGWPTLQTIMSTHFARWKFRHPKPADFFAIANEISGRDLTPFFDQVHRSSNVFDYGVQSLTSTPESGRYRTTVVVRRYGEAVWPIDVRVTFRDGTRANERWDGGDRWTLFTYLREAQAVSAEVDPDRVLLLDVNLTNNSKTLEPKSAAAATKWSMTWMIWLQDHLLTWAFFV